MPTASVPPGFVGRAPEQVGLMAIPLAAALLWAATGVLEPGALPERAACALLWLAALPAVVRLRAAFSSLPAGARVPSHLFAAATISLAHAAALAQLRPLLARNAMSVRGLLAHASFEGIVYAAMLVGAAAVDRWRAHRRAFDEASLAQARLAEAELASLEARFQPHFLFNALHSLSALIVEHPERVPLMAAKIQRFWESSLRPADPLETSLDDEIARLRDYLEIQSLRFEDRLVARIDVPLELSAAKIPRHLLQPLVENALRHGLSADGAARLEVGACQTGETLRLWVADGGRGMDARALREGRGLAHVRARLAHLHPGRHRLAFEAPAGSGLRVVIELPVAAGALPPLPPAERAVGEETPFRPPLRVFFAGWVAVSAFYFGRASMLGLGSPLSPGLRPLLAALAVWCAATPLVLWAAPRIDWSRPRYLLSQLGAALFVSACAATGAHAVAPAETTLPLATRIAYHLPFGLTIYTTLTLLVQLRVLPRRQAGLLRAAAQCREEAARRRADTLRLRLRDQDVRASLALIVESVRADPDEAVREVAALGERLRQSLSGASLEMRP